MYKNKKNLTLTSFCGPEAGIFRLSEFWFFSFSPPLFPTVRSASPRVKVFFPPPIALTFPHTLFLKKKKAFPTPIIGLSVCSGPGGNNCPRKKRKKKKWKCSSPFPHMRTYRYDFPSSKKYVRILKPISLKSSPFPIKSCCALNLGNRRRRKKLFFSFSDDERNWFSRASETGKKRPVRCVSLFSREKFLIFLKVVFDGSSLILIYFENASMCLQGTDGRRTGKFAYFRERTCAAAHVYLYFRGAQKLRHEFIRKYSRRAFVRSRHLQFSRHVRRKKKKLRKSLLRTDRPAPHIPREKMRRKNISREVPFFQAGFYGN